MSRILVFVLLLFSVCSFGQQIPQYSQFSRNPFAINPAAAGVENAPQISLAGRWQWLGVDDGPRTTVLSFSMPLTIKPKYYNPGIRTSSGPIKINKDLSRNLKHCVGGQIIADQYGAFRKLALSGSYAIHFPVGEKNTFSVGLKAGLSNNAFLSSKAQVLNVLDNSQLYTDNTYSNYISNQSNKYILDLGAGMYFYGQGFYVGFAAQQLTRDIVEFGVGSANFNPQVHYSLMGCYRWKLNNELTLKPNLLVKYMNPAPLSIDVNLQAEYKEWMWIGVGYRHTDAVIGMFGLQVNNRFKIGYSFDFSISRFKKYSSGGHELMLGLNLGN